MKTKLLAILAVAIGIQLSQPAVAELADTPYFNLWTGEAANGMKGQGARLTLCGTSDCNGDIDATDGVIGAGYAIFTALEKNTGKGSGAIDPFLRFQHNEGDANGNATTEAAFTTSIERPSSERTRSSAASSAPSMRVSVSISSSVLAASLPGGTTARSCTRCMGLPPVAFSISPANRFEGNPSP